MICEISYELSLCHAEVGILNIWKNEYAQCMYFWPDKPDLHIFIFHILMLVAVKTIQAGVLGLRFYTDVWDQLLYIFWYEGHSLHS